MSFSFGRRKGEREESGRETKREKTHFFFPKKKKKKKNLKNFSQETSGSAGQLLALYPFLFGLQFAQVAVGAQMLLATLKVAASAEGWLDPESAGSDLRGSRGVAVAGAAMVFMGCCNFANTVSTIFEKKRTRHVRTRGWGVSRGASAGQMRASSSSGAFPVSPTAAAAFGGALAGSNCNSANAAAAAKK